jgi:hypothetical protein
MRQEDSSATPFLGGIRDEASFFESIEARTGGEMDAWAKRHLWPRLYAAIKSFQAAKWKVGPDMTFDRSRSQALNILLFVFLILWSIEAQFLEETTSAGDNSATPVPTPGAKNCAGVSNVYENPYIRGILMVLVLSPMAIANNSERDLKIWRWIGAATLAVYFWYYVNLLAEYQTKKRKDNDLKCDMLCTVQTFYLPAMLGILFICLLLFIRVVFSKQHAYGSRKMMNRAHLRQLLKSDHSIDRGEDGHEQTRAERFLKVQDLLRPMYGNDGAGLRAGSIMIVQHIEDLRKEEEEQSNILDMAKALLKSKEERQKLTSDAVDSIEAFDARVKETGQNLRSGIKDTVHNVYEGLAERDLRKAAMVIKNKLKGDKVEQEQTPRVKHVDDFKYLPSLVIVSSAVVLILILGVGIAVHFLSKPVDQQMYEVVERANPESVLQEYSKIKDDALKSYDQLFATFDSLLNTYGEWEPQATEQMRVAMTDTKNTIDTNIEIAIVAENIIREKLQDFYTTASALRAHFKTCFQLANFLTCLCVFAFGIRGVYAFRKTQVLMRNGAYFSTAHPFLGHKFNCWQNTFSVAKSQRYIGLLLGSYVGGYIVVLVSLLIVLLVLGWKGTWLFIWHNPCYITAAGVSAGHVMLWENIFVARYLSDGFWIKR